jgi:hypothetical protein
MRYGNIWQYIEANHSPPITNSSYPFAATALRFRLYISHALYKGIFVDFFLIKRIYNELFINNVIHWYYSVRAWSSRVGNLL